MLIAVSCLIIVVILSIWIVESAKRPAIQMVINHYWYFSMLWLFFFPIRAILISEGMVDLQVEREWGDESLVYSLLLAFSFWLVGYLGYRSINVARFRGAIDQGKYKGKRVRYILWAFIFFAWFFIGNNLIDGYGIKQFKGNEQNEARIGAGFVFMLSVLYMLAFVAYLGTTIGKNGEEKESRISHYILVAAVLATSLILSVGLASRRYVAEPVLALIIVYLVTRGRGVALAIFSVIATVMAAPLLQSLRYMDINIILDSDKSISESFLQIIDLRYFLTIVSSSFEGVDHLAAYIEKAGWFGVLFGTDGGVAWIYNAVLSLVPRGLWPSKPEIYGSVAQQYFLYPWMYEDGAGTTTFPVSYVTDFIFGLGVLVGLVMAFFLGRVLKVLHLYMWGRHVHFVAQGVSLFVFINMFNVLRGGTGFLQSVVMLLVVSVFVFGVAPVKRAIILVVGDVMGRGGIGNLSNQPGHSLK